MSLHNGIYEQVINELLSKEINQVKEKKSIYKKNIEEEEASQVLSVYLQEVLRKALSYVSGEDKFQKQIGISNKIIQALQQELPQDQLEPFIIEEKDQLLLEVTDKEDQLPNTNPPKLVRPLTSISESSLFTGSLQEPSLLSELKKEIVTADQMDILVSFIKWSGLRLLMDELMEFTETNRLRVITTSYMGATDYKAIEELSKLPNTEIKVSYDTKRTRLHAKSYIFYRKSGFTTAYIGSSNLSNAAISSGLEWNVKVTEKDSKGVIHKCKGTFESYWNDREFTVFTTENGQQLKQALIMERKGSYDTEDSFLFEVEPYSYQKEILEELEAERTIHHSYRNLIVAATGTGKTVISAFDYKRFCKQHPQNRFLFVAHREEILKQSLACYRGILRDQNFGELWVGLYKPTQHDHLFISIQTFNSRDFTGFRDPDYYDYIVIDEFHHAAASSYQKLLTYFQPKILLGLTATPERMDGKDIREYFDGRIASELRLFDSINRKLLSPFQYFGISDSVDLSHIRWARGGYDLSDLDKVYTKNDQRASLIIQALKKYMNSLDEVVGLGFCVSVSHARYMAEYFSKHQIPSIALDSQSSSEERNTAKYRLVSGQLKFIFVVDLYNEGVDIPEVNTILFLRPTESLTVFLQQLGRGLRLSEGKECLTVFDFIGQAHKKYRFESKLRGLIGRTKNSLQKEVENGFPNIPKGCFIHLEKVAQERILENIRVALHNKRNFVSRIASFEEDTGLKPHLVSFKEYYEMEWAELYRNRRYSWSRLCVEAGVREDFHNPREEIITKALSKLQFINSRRWISFLLSLMDYPLQLEEREISVQEEQMLLMFHYTVWGKSVTDSGFSSVKDSFLDLLKNREMVEEVRTILSYNYQRIHFVDHHVNLGFENPLDLHCRYTRDQILSALGYYTEDKMPAQREGVLYLQDKKLDVFLVTLNKSEKDYTPTTLYNDYAINEILFHWQSQSTTSETSATGKRYIHHRETNNQIILFVRENKKENGIDGAPYYYFGKVNYVKHEGSKPMDVIWKLDEEMPAFLVKKAGRMVIG